MIMVRNIINEEFQLQKNIKRSNTSKRKTIGIPNAVPENPQK